MDFSPLPLRTEFLCRTVLTVAAPQPASEALRIVPVTGGTVSGPRLNGEVLPGTAADWLRLDPDGTAHMDVRLTLRATDGGIIYVHYTGVRTGPPAVLARLGAGEAVAPEEYYFRTAVRFETGAAAHAWLNRVIAVGVGQRPPSGPTYDLYSVQ